MTGFLVRGRVRVKIKIKIRVRVGVGVMFYVGVYHWSNCRRSKCRIFNIVALHTCKSSKRFSSQHSTVLSW